MEKIIELTKIDFIGWAIIFFLLLSAFIAGAEIIGKFSILINKPVKWVKKKNEDHELLIKTAQTLDALRSKHEEDIEQSTIHDQIIKADLDAVSNKMDALSEQITIMQNKMDETEMAKLKDSIITYYHKYKDAGGWSKLESDAFWELFHRYEAHGGNGFIHAVVEPMMREMKIID